MPAQNSANPPASESMTSRRQFLTHTAAAAAGAIAFPTIIPASALGSRQPRRSQRTHHARRDRHRQSGTNDIRSFLRDERVQIVAVCDVNRESAGYWEGKVGGREPAKRLVEEHYAKQNRGRATYKGRDTYVDFRELMGRKDIDAVKVSTPDHWHAIPAIAAAAKAGKDIYCQKPLSLTIAEGRAMSDAVKKYKRVFQTGSQQRSDSNFRRACELVRNGRIGKVKTVRVGLPGGRPDYAKTGDKKKAEPVPKGFEYDLWLGPAPEAPYAPARCHVNFRWIYDYSGGQVTDWGGHHPDCAQWGMGTEHTGPIEIRNAKATFPPDELWNTATDYFEGDLRDWRHDDRLRQGRWASLGKEGAGSTSTAASTTPAPSRSSIPRSAPTRSTCTRAATTTATSSTACSRGRRPPPRWRRPIGRSPSATSATSRCAWVARS